MSLSHLTINETPAVDTWNQERSTDHLQSFIGRLSAKAFTGANEDFDFS